MIKKKLDILYCVSHGFALRMILQTNLLNKLTEKGLHVGIIGPEISTDNLLDINISESIELIKFKPKIGFWTGQFQVLRNYILEDVKGNTALWDKHLERKRKSKGSVKKKLKNTIYLGVFYIVKVFPLLKLLYARLENKLLHSTGATQVLQTYRPNRLVSTYPVNWFEAILLQNANCLGIETTIHLLSWDNISCKGKFPALSQNHLAWGPIMKNEFVEYYGIASENIQITGVPHFDLHYKTVANSEKKDALLELELEPDVPYLLFAMSAPRFAPYEIDIVEWVADMVHKGEFEVNMNLVIRPHPQNVTGNMADSSWLRRLRNICSEKVVVDFPDLSSGNLAWGMQQNDMPRMSQLLHNAIACLNSGSTMSIDALLVETPVVITSFDGEEKLPYWDSARRLIDFPHLKKFIGIGNIPVVSNYDELKDAIKDIIDTNGNLSDSMRLVAKQECSDLAGKSTEAVVEKLYEMNNMSLIKRRRTSVEQ